MVAHQSPSTPPSTIHHRMKIATWNVNGIRARQAELQEFIEREQPDVLCLQEIKASLDQLPVWICQLEGYSCYWHGGKGTRAWRSTSAGRDVSRSPAFQHPAIRLRASHRHRAAAIRNGCVDLRTERRQGLRRQDALPRRDAQVCGGMPGGGTPLVMCGDMNVARTDMDVHPKERSPGIVGQRSDERALIEQILSHGLVDVHRTLDPDNADLFTWWAPWRNLKAAKHRLATRLRVRQ